MKKLFYTLALSTSLVSTQFVSAEAPISEFSLIDLEKIQPFSKLDFYHTIEISDKLKEFLEGSEAEFTQQQRDTIFRIVQDLYRQAARCMNDAQRLAWRIPEYSVRNTCHNAISAAIGAMTTKSVWSVVIAGALGAISTVTIKTLEHYEEVYDLVDTARVASKTAEYWEERLWKNK